LEVLRRAKAAKRNCPFHRAGKLKSLIRRSIPARFPHREKTELASLSLPFDLAMIAASVREPR
jgi:hypothetical protein